MFDGVHVGHRALLRHVATAARARGEQAAVVTFTTHPAATLRPGFEPNALSTNDMRRKLIANEGIDSVIELNFTRDLSTLTAAEFLREINLRYGVNHLVAGFNTTIGSDRVSGLEALSMAGAKAGVTVEVAPELKSSDMRVCSSSVRKLLADGLVEQATAMLGRYYQLSGTVEHGHEIGRTIGFPTANIAAPATMQIPGSGVYACYIYIAGKRYKAMVNIGHRPTFNNGANSTIEAYIIGFEGDIYGEIVSLEFVKRLRGEQKFASPHELRTQLELDRQATENALL